MIITLMSDTHNKHNQITNDLPSGDVLIHSGDISGRGSIKEITNFCDWFDTQNYTTKIFIAGNHDWGFQDNSETIRELIATYKNIIYLEDDLHVIGSDYNDGIKIWGSPWQPEFYSWAFNLPKNGAQLKEKWSLIPKNTDILITHGPAYGHHDMLMDGEEVGCKLLAERIHAINPKIHVCGHIHCGYGYKYNNDTHFFNASVLGEDYQYRNKPISFNWDKNTNEITFL